MPDDTSSVEQFLFVEARLADEHDYEAWEALWTDDGVYRVPADGPLDATDRMAIIDDNRHRIATRVKQLQTGRRLAQAPPSRLRRLVSNIEVLGAANEEGDLAVEANVVVFEGRPAGVTTWAGRVRYHLRATPGGWQMAYKQVDLVNRPWDVPTLAFLI